MIIRKLFTFEGAHIVRNCSSRRCRENLHGHSYTVEVFLSSDRLDNGCMVLDFGLLGEVRELIDSFDHACTLWQGEDPEIQEWIRRCNCRVVEMPVSPTSEGFALLFFFLIDRLLSHTVYTNGEGKVPLSSVRVHETATGYAEAFREDLKWVHFTANEVRFSEGIREEWKNNKWWEKLIEIS